MANEQTIKNQDSGEKCKVWVEKGEIVYIKIAKVVVEKDVDWLIKETKRILKGFSGQAKILVNMGAIENTLGIRSPQFRRRTSKQIKDLIEDPGFRKAALFGGHVMHRTIASFIIAASGMKNIKIFGSKEEALKWLK